MIRYVALVGAIVCSVAVSGVCGQCESVWLPMPAGGGIGGPVTALGAFRGEVVVGGEFTQASGTAANHVARWNGSAWVPLGTGVNSTILALTEFEDTLIAAGSFTQAGGMPAARVAAWNGNQWSALGSQFISDAEDLGVYAGALIAAGFAPGRVVTWDGASWTPVGGGFPNADRFTSLAVFDGKLFAGGGRSVGFEWFGRVAIWDGSQWTNVDPASPRIVMGFGEHANMLFATGFIEDFAPSAD